MLALQKTTFTVALSEWELQHLTPPHWGQNGQNEYLDELDVEAQNLQAGGCISLNHKSKNL